MSDLAPAQGVKIIWTFTFLNDYENCPHKAFRRYIAKDVPYIETDAMRWGNVVHTAFEKRLRHGEPLPDTLAHLEPFATALTPRRPVVEYKLGIRADGRPCGFYDDNVWGRGKADVAIIESDRGVIVDWKTGKQREDARELEILGLLLQAAQPHVRTVVGHYVWIADNQLGTPHDVSNTAGTWRRVQSMMAQVNEYARLNHWPKNENPLCKWCPVMDCNFNRNPDPAARKAWDERAKR